MNAPVPLGPWRQDWVYRQRTVETFMGRRGDVCLGVGDIIWAGGAPIFAPVFLGAPSSQCNPPLDADDTRLATTWFVRHLIEELSPSQGPPGPQGPPGTGIILLGTVATAADLPAVGSAVGDAYIALDTGVLWVWDGTAWIAMAPGPQGPAGAAGAPGAPGPTGAQGPQGEPGTGFDVKGSVTDPSQLPPTGNTNGDVYIDESTGKGWVWDGDEWVEFDLGAEGPQGPIGPPGPQGDAGLAGADGANGADGAPGPQGPTGAQGPQGPIGAPGSGGISGLSGDVTGTGTGTISTTVAGLRGRVISTAAPAANQALVWNGSQWAPAAIVNSFNGRTGPVTLSSADITGAGGAVGNFVRLTGDSMTGGLTMTQRAGVASGFNGGLKVTATGAATWPGSYGSISADVMLSKLNTGLCQVAGATNGVLRWQVILASSASETGGNVGSGFQIARSSDAGALLDTPLQIARANGTTTFSVPIINGPSDARLKENVEPITAALAKVKALRGVTFTMKANPNDRTSPAALAAAAKRHIGLIAQEVQPIVPEVMQEWQREEGGTTYLSLDYGHLVALLIEAVKELAGGIDDIQHQEHGRSGVVAASVRARVPRSRP